MPGWWFPIESTERDHLLHQFWISIKRSMESTEAERQLMLDAALVERFPVKEWKEKLEDLYYEVMKLQGKSLGSLSPEEESNRRTHEPAPVNHGWGHVAGFSTIRRNLSWSTIAGSIMGTLTGSSLSLASGRSSSTLGSKGSWTNLGSIFNRSQKLKTAQSLTNLSEIDARSPARKRFMAATSSNLQDDAEQALDGRSRISGHRFSSPNLKQLDSNQKAQGLPASTNPLIHSRARGQSKLNFSRTPTSNSSSRSRTSTPDGSNSGIVLMSKRAGMFDLTSDRDANDSDTSVMLSIDSRDKIKQYIPKFDVSVIQQTDDIQDEDPFDQYMDEDGTMIEIFKQNLANLTEKSSVKEHCIDYVIDLAEKQFYIAASKSRVDETLSMATSTLVKMCQRFAHYRIRTWPVYTILLALGQLFSATAFQIVLLTGSWTINSFDFNIIGVFFILGTVFFWTMYRMAPAFYSLTIPFLFFAVSMIFVAIPVVGVPLLWTKKISVWFYAFGSGAGSLFFALNFGEEAGVQMSDWIFRAGLVEGVRQLWTVVLWFWSQTFASDAQTEGVIASTPPSAALISISLIMMLVMIFLFVTLFFGLPKCYHHAPPQIPGFYRSLLFRKLAIWFLVAQFVQAYWLSAPYGRNWQFLWRQRIPISSTVLMIFIFSCIWVGIMYVLKRHSKVHTWLLPVIAVGLLSPRWAQMSWSTSNIGSAMDWGGVVAVYFSLALWLWLGVLDAIQSVGLSMMLLQTLTRVHVAATLMLCQVVGSIAFILARETAPNSKGPGDVFPDPSLGGVESPIQKPIFWLALIFQIVVAIGYLIWFRKEQLSRA